MDITNVKWWKKTVKGDNVDHVRIGYAEGDMEQSLHQFGDNAEAAPEFYKAFEAFSPIVTKTVGLPEKLATGIKVDSVSITYSEDKEGTENTKYALSCKVKAGHATAVLNVTTQHKFIPEGFEEAMTALVNEAADYVEGKRAQTELFERKSRKKKK